jgi:hypothetical protein
VEIDRMLSSYSSSCSSVSYLARKKLVTMMINIVVVIMMIVLIFIITVCCVRDTTPRFVLNGWNGKLYTIAFHGIGNGKQDLFAHFNKFHGRWFQVKFHRTFHLNVIGLVLHERYGGRLVEHGIVRASRLNGMRNIVQQLWNLVEIGIFETQHLMHLRLCHVAIQTDFFANNHGIGYAHGNKIVADNFRFQQSNGGNGPFRPVAELDIF